MNKYSTALDELVEHLQTHLLDVNVSRDPSLIAGLIGGTGMVFVGFPAITDKTQGASSVDVPVSLIHSNPPDLQAGEWLLDHLDAFVDACRTDTTSAGQFEIGSLTYPAVTVTVRLLV